MNKIDQNHIWHPYSSLHTTQEIYQVVSATGCKIKLADGRELVDGMASWWCMIHGYNHPQLNQAISAQLGKFSHVMFGGLTHQPAVDLTKKIVEITPETLQTVFFSDSGSVAVEVAMKMALQYWQAKGEPDKQQFISLRSGYHGDTLAAMSLSDPDTGMHSLFHGVLPKQLFISQPQCRFGESCSDEDIKVLVDVLSQNSGKIAGIFLEPIVQGAGGMWFYSADYLNLVRELCDKYSILLLVDEIATGFGRTGKLFACEYAGISPDIMTIGKALTGGYLTMAATLTTTEVACGIESGEPGVFMHGPTFMANPLACSVANASINLLLESNWQDNIHRIERLLKGGLELCRSFTAVADVRVLGAIGVVELQEPVNMQEIVPAFVKMGVWVRPFGKLIYLMPPFVISNRELQQLIDAVVTVIKSGE